MSYKITAYRANGTSRDWADVFDEDALRLLSFWDRGLPLPAVRVNLGQQQERSVLINRDVFEAIDAEATPLVLNGFIGDITTNVIGVGTISTTEAITGEISSLGCGVLATATTAGGLVDATEE